MCHDARWLTHLRALPLLSAAGACQHQETDYIYNACYPMPRTPRGCQHTSRCWLWDSRRGCGTARRAHTGISVREGQEGAQEWLQGFCFDRLLFNPCACSAGNPLPPEAFYNTLISEKMDVQDHYSAWRVTQVGMGIGATSAYGSPVLKETLKRWVLKKHQEAIQVQDMEGGASLKNCIGGAWAFVQPDTCTHNASTCIPTHRILEGMRMLWQKAATLWSQIQRLTTRSDRPLCSWFGPLQQTEVRGLRQSCCWTVESRQMTECMQQGAACFLVPAALPSLALPLSLSRAYRFALL